MNKTSSPALNRRRFLQLSSAAGLLLPASTALGQQTYVVAETKFGKIRGTQTNGIKSFKGIPYGGNTGGSNRFMPPTNPVAWAGTKDTLIYGSAAPQSDPATGRQQDGRESEDCLILNVWTQGLNDGQKRPVMFWCHGGGFRTLSGSSPRYDGTNLSLRGDVVVVTVNHRLNMMGFTHFGDLNDDAFASSGTVGMQDIVHGLKWVRDNIEQFGGDPERVMIFGESGGGRKVATLLGMPSAKGLFHGAVIESGATLRLPERDQATQLAELVLAKLGISPGNIGSIQDVPLRNMMAAYHAVTSDPNIPDFGGNFAPVRDGDVLPYHPFYPDASPVNPDVPVIVGANRTEMTYFANDADFELDEQSMLARISNLVGEDNSREVIDVYRQANPDVPPWEIYFLVFSDSRYVMPSITIAERRAALSGGPTHLYYLTWESAGDDGRILSPHTLDIPFIFDNVRSHPLTMGSASAIVLADKISDSIIGFARTGNPDVGKLPDWTGYDSTSRATMVWNDSPQVINDPIGRQREVMQPLLNL